ncbi:MAG: hypothetical protein A2445_05535 [Candidatus Jacksonbacteria bacterium RIFOXYC2_FULL_44_29]|nr:MAG: hypothetical protein A2295_03955 [Candidatus Jacksonbacteria bacterium RIFOXYB2_FULL_44_15]OGY80993.1 MAG: hypothetical protein A2445_05535 [Candidatus Jacksonbacteria bacterium RIFOXYC2_FULL_44_29]
MVIGVAIIIIINLAILAPAGKPGKPVTLAGGNGATPTNLLPGSGQNNASASTAALNQQLANQSKIKKFKDYQELRTFLEENSTSGGSYGYEGGMGRGIIGGMEELSVQKEMAVPSSAPSEAPIMDNGSQNAGEGTTGSSDYSQTNVQVAGVDEGDIIKTDGKYIYSASKKNLFIIDAFPGASANILAKIAFDSTPQGIYLNGDRLIVYGRNDVIYQSDVYQTFRRRGDYTFLKVFDISDPKNPKQVRDLDFEGNYNNSRMIGDYVYFVTAAYMNALDDDLPVPRMLENGAVVAMDDAVSCKRCPAVYYFDMPYQSYNFTTVTAINTKDSAVEPMSEVYVLSDNQNMYVSSNNIYITYTKYISEYQLVMEVMRELVYPRLPAKDQERIAKIEAVDNFILTQEEKMQKIGYIVEKYQNTLTDEERTALQQELENRVKQKYQDIAKELEKTVVHKIAIQGGELKYITYGEVPGQVLNQFSMDEADGYFRIATTKNRSWSQFIDSPEEQESYSNLYVLGPDLKVVGSLEKLAPGEKIYSVRFMQNRAYLVTFKQMDPLFVIDLSNPTSPAVLGALKIPGFSNYLHPYDDKTLIGLGRDTKENQWGGVVQGGIKLSLFDVADVANPKEIDSFVIGGQNSDSVALTDHHAFLFSKEKNLLVIPVELRQDYYSPPMPMPQPMMLEDSAAGSTGSEIAPDQAKVQLTVPPKTSALFRAPFRGAAVFTVTPQGFELKGKIDHSDGKLDTETEYWYGYSYYDTTVKRSLYIDDLLYTYSNKYLKINQLTDLDSVKKLELKKEAAPGDDFNVVN